MDPQYVSAFAREGLLRYILFILIPKAKLSMICFLQVFTFIRSLRCTTPEFVPKSENPMLSHSILLS